MFILGTKYKERFYLYLVIRMAFFLKINYMNQQGIVLVTGGGGAIGSAIALRFADAGFSVGVLDQNELGMKALAVLFDKTKIPFFYEKVDLTQKELVLQSVENCKQFYKTEIVGIVNCAAINKIEKFSYDSIDDFERILRINVMANIVPTGVCLSDLVRNKGFVITISSVAGFAPLYGRTSYCASKFALHGFFETLRTEHLGVLDIMLVCPTFVDTAFGNSENKKEISKKLTPNEVANGIYNAYLKKVKFLSLGKNSKLARLIYKFFPNFYIKKMMEQNKF